MGDIENIIAKDVEEYHDLLKNLGVEDKDTIQHKNRAHPRFNFDIPETKFILEIGDDT